MNQGLVAECVCVFVAHLEQLLLVHMLICLEGEAWRDVAVVVCPKGVYVCVCVCACVLPTLVSVHAKQFNA